jgi:hypothetical protein
MESFLKNVVVEYDWLAVYKEWKKPGGLRREECDGTKQ